MPRLVGISSITLQEGVNAEEFKRLILEEVFDEAAEAEGVFRNGVSMIKSQHLLESHEGTTYLWVVKAHEDLDASGTFSAILSDMRKRWAEKLEKSAVIGASTIHLVSGSFDAGPRTSTGRLLGRAERGDFF